MEIEKEAGSRLVCCTEVRKTEISWVVQVQHLFLSLFGLVVCYG